MKTVFIGLKTGKINIAWAIIQLREVYVIKKHSRKYYDYMVVWRRANKTNFTIKPGYFEVEWNAATNQFEPLGFMAMFANKKIGQGYEPLVVNGVYCESQCATKLNEVFPDFEAELEQMTTWNLLKL